MKTIPDGARPADRFVFAGLILLLLWLPLPWGSHVPWAALLIGAAAASLLMAWLLLAVLGKASLPGRAAPLLWPLAAWIAWIGWIALQLLPLDAAQLAQLSAQAAQRHVEVAAADAVALNTISIAPSLTFDGLLLTLAYFCLYWLVVVTASEHPGRLRMILIALLVAGMLQAIYGSLMVLSKLEIGFLVEKRHYFGNATGTFINRNHFANYLALASAAGIGLILADLQRGGAAARSWRRRLSELLNLLLSNKLRVRIGLAIIVIGIVMSRSRMGNLAFFASLCLCGFAFVLVRERALAMRAAILFLSLVLVDVLIVSRWFGLERVVERLEQTDLSTEGRARLLDELPPVIDSYVATGSGLGTFALAYEGFRSPRMRDYYDHAHNDYAQFLIEVGAPGAALLLLLAGMHYLHALRVILRRRRRFPPAVCFATIMGLTAAGLHALTEFNLQIPANAATLVVLMALAACCPAQGGRRARRTSAAEAPDAAIADAAVRPQAVPGRGPAVQ